LKQKASQYPGEPKLTSQFTGLFKILPAGPICDTLESKLSGAQGQSFFWEPVNNDIPETELSQ
jgi:hypothetical protein